MNRVFNYVFIVQYRAAYLACPVMFCSSSCSLQLTVSVWSPGNAFLQVHLCSPVYVLAISCGTAPYTPDNSPFFPPYRGADKSLARPGRKQATATKLFNTLITISTGPGWLSCYSDSLRAGRSGDLIPLEASLSAPVQPGPGAHPASYTMVTGSFPGLKRPGRDVDRPPYLSPRLKKE